MRASRRPAGAVRPIGIRDETAIGGRPGAEATGLTGGRGGRRAEAMGAEPSPTTMPRRRRRFVAAAALLACALLFVALGLWQVERRAEKLALIDAVEGRLHSAAVAAPGPADWPKIGKGD